jgi:glyoxalase family protein
MELGGLHHVTAVTTEAQSNVEFYTGVLGLRLVKKTVNQDDTSAYHLFYADAEGNPGTDMTFFDWPQLRVAANRSGAGEVSTTAFRVADREALEWWASRLEEKGVDLRGGVVERDGVSLLDFTDHEGQRLRLVADDGYPEGAGTVPGVPWTGAGVPERYALRGFSEVDLTVRDLEPTALVLEEVLGFRRVGEGAARNGSGRVVTFEVGPGGPGARLRVLEDPTAPFAHLGRGGVHHVAFRVKDDEEQAAWQERLTSFGLRATPVIDRYYFRSVYFREPGGVLYELATDGPGFTGDEDLEHLGERLSLPPFLEERREEIEGRLTPIAPVGSEAR